MTQALHKISGGFRNFPGYVFPVDTHVSFQLSVENEFIRTHHDSIRVQYIRDDWRVEDGSIAYWEPDLLHYWQQVKYVYQDGILYFELTLSGEHEHWIGITAETETDLYSEEFALCTLKDDLLQYFPFKGNVHTHSTGSDGIYPPQIVAARMRRAGFDFTAVTDHHKYTPSLEAIAAITPLGSGLECYRGEEAENMGPGMTHILSLGAKSSISDWKNDQTGNFLQKVEALKKHLPADLPEHERTYIAQFETIAARIREQGGLAVFCHPYWRQWRIQSCAEVILMPLNGEIITLHAPHLLTQNIWNWYGNVASINPYSAVQTGIGTVNGTMWTTILFLQNLLPLKILRMQ